MLPASMKGPGTSFGAPDVCLTPVGPVIVPIPYPNFAAHAMACVFSSIVTVNMMPALNLASIIAMTTGDEPGVAHPTIMGIGNFVVGNPVVSVEGLPGIMVTAQTMGNLMNCPTGTVIAPGSGTVFYTLAPAAAEGEREAPSPGELLSGSPLHGATLLEGGVGLVRVRVFSLGLPGAVHLALERLAAQGMRALVLDLVDCPGGELSAMLELASDFLPAGARIATLRDAEGDESPRRAQGGPWAGLPLFVAVSRRTASAAELFAGSLAAHGRATVVGERTFGKGVALTAADETVAEVLLPDGSSLHGVGLVPHMEYSEKSAVQEAISLARDEIARRDDGRLS